MNRLEIVVLGADAAVETWGDRPDDWDALLTSVDRGSERSRRKKEV